MKRILLLSIIVCSALFSPAQKIIKEKTETKVDGPYVTKKTKVEYERSSVHHNASATTVLGTSSSSHKAYRSRHLYGVHKAHKANPEFRSNRPVARKHSRHRHHFMQFREYKRVTKHGKTKVKYKR